MSQNSAIHEEYPGGWLSDTLVDPGCMGRSQHDRAIGMCDRTQRRQSGESLGRAAQVRDD
jgi:hypothetical protein